MMIPRQECNKTPFVLFAVFFLVFSVIFSGCTVRKAANPADPETISCISHGWPQDTSDLSPDPALVFGSLANGVRYVIKHNGEPKGRVALYLDVQAGSLNETDQQRGLAHYLEHMVFNGTAHFPPGTLIRYFQSIGMSFGADTNAHTSYDETVYKLLLPAPDDKTVDEGMLVLADYARRALLLESEVEKERGVILSEKRARDSAGARIEKNLLKHEFFGTRVAERDPIGVEQTILAADSKRLRAFYDAWYRPENMIVVLVGDVDTGQAKKAIIDYFSGLHGAAVRPKCYDFGHIPEKSTDFFYQYEPDFGKTEITLAATWNIDPTADTIGKEKLLLQNYVAAAIVNDRLQHLINTTGSPLTRAQAYSGTFVQRLGYFVISGQTTADKWRPSLTRLEHILRQTTSYGVTEQELARVEKELQAELDQAVQTEKSRDSSKLAAEFIRKLNDNEVILSPVQEKKLYARLLGELTVADIHKALLRMNTHVRHVVGVAGTVDLGKEKSKPEDVLRRTWAAIAAAPVHRWSGEKVAPFPYLSPPAQQGKIEKIIDHPAIGMTTTVLQNGIRINVKKTSFKEHEALLTVNFSHGSASEPAAGLDKLAEAVVNESGVGRLTKEQLETALAGRNAQVHFSVGPESFRFSGKGLSRE
ncbi:MAG TPA: insulinase family protein, partial [Desulfobulbus sp.]|nr:insulinase family protein [Desulfobulbus sp.]